MGERRTALLIGSDRFDDPRLRGLVSPPHDLDALAAVLQDETRGGFTVTTLRNHPCHQIAKAVESFFNGHRKGDLALFYYTGHGIKDEDGRLYFAAADTDLQLLRSSALAASLVNEIAAASRSDRQVHLLDCCYSGAFTSGMTARAETAVHVGESLKAQGRVVLTASNATQYSFEGETRTGQGVRSLFTRRLIEGMETGDADLDGDGLIALDELYEYVYQRVVADNPAQRPAKWSFGVEGRIVLARSPKPPRPVELPAELQQSIGDLRNWVRFGAVAELDSLLANPDPNTHPRALEALRHLAQNDDSQRVREAAATALRNWESRQEGVDLPAAPTTVPLGEAPSRPAAPQPIPAGSPQRPPAATTSDIESSAAGVGGPPPAQNGPTIGVRSKWFVLSGLALLPSLTACALFAVMAADLSPRLGNDYRLWVWATPLVVLAVMFILLNNHFYSLALSWSATGLRALHDGDWKAAENAFRKVAFWHPALSSWAYGSLGVALKHQGRFAEAKKAFRTALTISPQAQWISTNLGLSQRQVAP